MSLKEAAESTVHTLSELVDEATNRLEDLPVPFQRHHQNSRRGPALIVFAVVAALAAALWMARRRRSTSAARRTTADATPTRSDLRAAGSHVDEVRKSA